MTQPQIEMFDLYRVGLRTAADTLKASLESAERLQNQQLVAIRTAIVEQAKSAGELGSARTLDELLSAQTKFAGAQLERAIGYWGELCKVAGENQLAAIGQMQAQIAQAGHWFSETYALTARATEEAARFAAAATANAGVRQGGGKQEQRKSA